MKIDKGLFKDLKEGFKDVQEGRVKEWKGCKGEFGKDNKEVKLSNGFPVRCGQNSASRHRTPRKELMCIKCGKVVARYTGTIEGEYTWFSVCSICCFNVKGWTKRMMEKELKRLR